MGDEEQASASGGGHAATSEAAADVVAAGPSAGAPAGLIDATQLAGIMMQARGPVLDRLGRAMDKFDGSANVDVQQWLDFFERRCGVERADPCDFIEFLLDKGAHKLFTMMTVEEAKSWPTIRDRLMRQYGLPEQQAYQRFVARRMASSEPVDVYVNDLTRYGSRVGVTQEDKFFRVAFLEGLPVAVYKWAVMLADVYTCGFSDLVEKIRRRLASLPSRALLKGPVAAGAAKGAKGAPKCNRCNGGHLVSKCTSQRRPGSGHGVKKCFRCKKPGHFVNDCPVPAGPAASAAAPANFRDEVDGGGATTSDSEMVTDDQ